MDTYAKFMELAMKQKETRAYLRQSIFYLKENVRVNLQNLCDLIWVTDVFQQYVLSMAVSFSFDAEFSIRSRRI